MGLDIRRRTEYGRTTRREVGGASRGKLLGRPRIRLASSEPSGKAGLSAARAMRPCMAVRRCGATVWSYNVHLPVDTGRPATGRRKESMQAKITGRRVRAEEWERLRAIRLHALADAPMAFGSTLADEQTRPDEFWRGRAAGGASDDDRATFIAECDGVWVGIGTCVLEEGGTGERPAWVFGMWVDPAVRRQGTAQALLRVLAGWA